MSIPFHDTDTVHIGFAVSVVPSRLTADLYRYAPDRLYVAGDDLYLHLPNGVAASRLAILVSKWRPTATVRNWRTVAALASMP